MSDLIVFAAVQFKSNDIVLYQYENITLPDAIKKLKDETNLDAVANFKMVISCHYSKENI